MVWLNGKKISTMQSSPKLENILLGLFNIISKIPLSMYKLKLPETMRRVHPIFQVLILRQNRQETIGGRPADNLEPVIVHGEKEWEVEEVAECRRRGRKLQYFFSWKGFGPANNSWEPRRNVENVRLAVEDFDSKHPTVAAQHRRSERRK